MSPDVRIHTYTEPPAYLPTLLTAHLPHSLPLLRRLQFTRFPGGITPHARILVAARSAPDLLLAEPCSSPFAAAYVDLSRGPETQVWVYSSVEHCAAAEDPGAVGCATALLREVKRLRADEAGAGARGPDDHHDTVMLGTLSERLRVALEEGAGLVFPYTEVYDKWLFRVGELPEVDDADVAERLGEMGKKGWRWDRARREDIPFMLSRTHIPRKERTVKLLPSTAIYLENGSPIAWSFLGPDSSLSSLHCEKTYRGKGLAKAVAVKLLRDHLKDYGDEEYGWADVAPDNPPSQGVCKSLGGKIGWQVS
ncbi:hypothetical protein F4810DRAFT_283712 [Camillea tinctor]|nr:hypothetical protein F4810DRAFT_283712 [Camillea tinctor]